MFPLLLACAGPAADDTAPLVPSAWSWEAVPDAPAPYPADTARQGVEDAFARVWTIDPRDPYDANVAMIDAGDGTCPIDGSHNGLHYVTGDCISADGLGYYGFVQYNQLFDFYYNGGAWNHEFRWVTGTFRVLATDGSTFATQGEIEYHDYTDADGRQAWSSHIWGEFHWTGPSATPGWLGEDLSLQFDMDAHIAGAPVNDGRWLWLDGSVARLGGVFDAVEFDNLTMPGETCATEPDGDIWLHDDQGLWYTVHFDAVCDGCGQLVANEGTPTEQALGPVCPDLSTVTTWGPDPWSR